MSITLSDVYNSNSNDGYSKAYFYSLMKKKKAYFKILKDVPIFFS